MDSAHKLDPEFHAELIAADAFVAETAVIRGDVRIGAQSSVWFHAVIRGDTAPVHIGRRCNVQDGCVLHADPGFPCELGDGVTVGHAAIVHGARVEDDVLIGMRAVVMNGCQIGANSIIGAGAVLPEGTRIPPASLVLGVPGRVRREVGEADLQRIRHAATHYVAAAQAYREAARKRSAAAGQPPGNGLQ